MQSNPHAVRLLVAAAASVAVALAPASYAAAGAEPDPWSLTTSPAVGQDSSFKAVAAVAANDAWAVGATDLFDGGTQQKTLAQHWDGARWTTVPTPNPTLNNTLTNGDVFNAAAAISSRDVWAVGYTGVNGLSYTGSLTEHWDGTAWKAIPSPNGVSPTFRYHNQLLGVAGTAANDVWAVGWNGFLLGPDLHRPTIQHWNGSAWSLVTVPPIGDNAQNVVVTAVTARTATDAWATGYYSNDDQGPITHPFALHWNGAAWTRADPVDVVLGAGAVNRVNLIAVRAITADDVWAAGNVLYTDAQGAGQSRAIVQHWNGTAWSLVSTPNADGTSTTLTGLAVLGAADIWAAGTTAASASGGTREALLEHWDGRAWTAVPLARADKAYNCGFFGASAAGQRALAVGACNAVDAATQPLAIPFAATTPAVTGGGGGTAPAAPTGLTATASSPTQVGLTWRDNATDETGFAIERCRGAGCIAFTQIATASADATVFTDTGLTRNTSYTYRVRAVNAAGASAYSGTATARTPRS